MRINDDCASNEPLDAMATALSGHVSRKCRHAHAEPWAWRPSMRLVRCADINTKRKTVLVPQSQSPPGPLPGRIPRPNNRQALANCRNRLIPARSPSRSGEHCGYFIEPDDGQKERRYLDESLRLIQNAKMSCRSTKDVRSTAKVLESGGWYRNGGLMRSSDAVL